MIVDINVHHLPEDLFTNEKVLDGFLSTAPRSFGEIASLGTVASGKKQSAPHLNRVNMKKRAHRAGNVPRHVSDCSHLQRTDSLA